MGRGMFPVCGIDRIKNIVQVYLCKPRATLSEVGLFLLKVVVLRFAHVKECRLFVEKRVVCASLQCVVCGGLLCCVVWSCLVLSCLVLSCLVLACLVLSCLVLSCLVLSCLVLSCLVLSCLVLSCLVLSCLVLSCLVLSCLVLSCLVLSCLVLSCLVLSCLVWCGINSPCLNSSSSMLTSHAKYESRARRVGNAHEGSFHWRFVSLRTVCQT